MSGHLSMRIAVDLDGVLADTIVPVCNILNHDRSSPLSVESFNQWNAWEIAGITKDQFFRTLDEAWFSWEKIPPTEDDLAEKVGGLREFGVVDIVTGRSPATVAPAKNWLKRHGIQYNSFVRALNSTDGKTRLSYDVYIDDNAELMAILASRLHVTGIMYIQPWNRKTKPLPRIHKAEKWNEIPAIIRQIDSRIK